MIKSPTNKDKIKMYEDFLHQINMSSICMNNDAIHQLIKNANNWSYAHRKGNGIMTEKEQSNCVNQAFWNLCKIK